MTTVPADIVNQALTSIGVTNWIGDLQEGSEEARAALRVYGTTLRGLLRAAHWNFARQRVNLTLLQDQTGQSAAPVGTGTPGMGPWVYEYQWPTDALKARYVPLTYPTAASTAVPIMTGLTTTLGVREVPARFVVSKDYIPALTGAPSSWSQVPDIAGVQGEGLTQQTVILTNVQSAALVYTALVTYPDEWDPLFRQAMVTTLGSELALFCIKDKREAIAVRQQMIATAKDALTNARIADGDEGWYTTNREASWIRGRAAGPAMGAWWWSQGPGTFWYGWDSMAFCDGTSY